MESAGVEEREKILGVAGSRTELPRSKAGQFEGLVTNQRYSDVAP